MKGETEKNSGQGGMGMVRKGVAKKKRLPHRLMGRQEKRKPFSIKPKGGKVKTRPCKERAKKENRENAPPQNAEALFSATCGN